MKKIKWIHHLKNCARCGGTHAQIEMRPFSQNPPDGYGWWAICPTNGEPILVKVTQKRFGASPIETVRRQMVELEQLQKAAKTHNPRVSYKPRKNCTETVHFWHWDFESFPAGPPPEWTCQCGAELVSEFKIEKEPKP